MFFVATAPEAGRANLSPKGMDSFRVFAPNRVAYLDHYRQRQRDGRPPASKSPNHLHVLLVFAQSADPAPLRPWPGRANQGHRLAGPDRRVFGPTSGAPDHLCRDLPGADILRLWGIANDARARPSDPARPIGRRVARSRPAPAGASTTWLASMACRRAMSNDRDRALLSGPRQRLTPGVPDLVEGQSDNQEADRQEIAADDPVAGGQHEGGSD